MKKSILFIVQQILQSVWALFKAGLLTLLPLLLTIAAVGFIIKSIGSILYPLRSLIDLCTPYMPDWTRSIPHIDFIVLIILLIVIGKAINIFIFSSLITKFEHWLDKVPFIRPIYSGMKQLVSAFGTHEQASIKEIVLVEITQGVHSIGFVTGTVPPSLTPKPTITYENVFVPTTPNPTGGFFYVIEKSKLMSLNVTRQQAMTYIMSVGLIHPHQSAETDESATTGKQIDE